MHNKDAAGYISAAPAPNERERLDYLNNNPQLFDSQKDDIFYHLIQLTCKWLNMPMAAISFIDKEREWFKSKCGFSISEMSRDISFCSHTILEQLGMVVPDTHQDERFRDNPFVKGEPYIRFYAGAPIIIPDGLVLGSLCVFDTKPRLDFTEEHKETLDELAQMVSNLIEMQVLHTNKLP